MHIIIFERPEQFLDDLELQKKGHFSTVHIRCKTRMFRILENFPEPDLAGNVSKTSFTVPQIKSSKSRKKYSKTALYSWAQSNMFTWETWKEAKARFEKLYGPVDEESEDL